MSADELSLLSLSKHDCPMSVVLTMMPRHLPVAIDSVIVSLLLPITGHSASVWTSDRASNDDGLQQSTETKRYVLSIVAIAYLHYNYDKHRFIEVKYL